ncbi:hypothetical protein [Actinotignum schaalii]
MQRSSVNSVVNTPFNIRKGDKDVEFKEDGSILISTQNLLKRKNRERRGSNINNEIRAELTSMGWEMFPPIELADYYGDVQLSPRPNAANRDTSSIQGSVLSLLKADEPDDLDYLTYGMTPNEALDRMQNTGRSKMPLSFSESDKASIIGSVTVSDLARGITAGQSKLVEMAQTQVPIFPTERKLSDCIPSILQHGFIYGSDTNGRIVQIYTLADLAKHLHSTTEMFLRVQEIENLIRRILGQVDEDILRKAVSETKSLTDIKKADDSGPLFNDEDINYGQSSESEQYIERLTFAGYMKCFSSKEVWKQCLSIDGLDKDRCLTALNDARLARNKVMHISSDEIIEMLTPSFECLATWLRKAAPKNQPN